MTHFKHYFNLFEAWNAKHLEINAGFGNHFTNNLEGIRIHCLLTFVNPSQCSMVYCKGWLFFNKNRYDSKHVSSLLTLATCDRFWLLMKQKDVWCIIIMHND